ncbi:Delta [Spathaspora sp. JA1]|nr:Delta [Spathaspora sp. JA1]
MDLVLEVCDYYLFDQAYSKLLPRDGTVHQLLKNSPIVQTISKVQLPSVSSLLTQDGLSANSTLAPSFNISSLNAATVQNYILYKLANFQDKSEIYGLAPNYFPAGPYIDGSFLSRSNILRESLSLLVVASIFGWLLYFIVAYLSYVFVFDRKIFNHPRYLKNQMALEIHRATTAIPVMVSLTIPFWLVELHGYSRLYMDIGESTGGWKAVLLQFPKFILFTDCGIYFIHRWLHWPSVYKRLHKPHHKWIVCTPFASHAFHPVDGFAQSLPYHIYPLFFPLQKVLYLGLFTFVNFWTVMIHDGNYMSNDPFVNGTACHTIHHLYFNYNYGQFTTLWDRIGGSYRRPDDSLFVKDSKAEDDKKVWKEQTKQMEEIRGELEGKVDDREYIET